MDPTMKQTSIPHVPLLPFAAVIFATVCWVVLVVIVLPRLLGRVLAFLANRAARGAYHISIPILHIYPLAGRVVVHSFRYTVPDGSISAEELVFQVRWWRKARDSAFRTLLVIDDAHALDPVAVAQQEIVHENTAFFIKRIWFRLRRWWRRSAITTDHSSAEPSPLISLIAVGLRARIVNVKSNYEHVTRVLELARAVAEPSSQSASHSSNVRFELPIPSEDPVHVGNSADQTRRDSATESSYSTPSAAPKPWLQLILELISLRITSGAFYFCDMGHSPLLRVVVDSAKIRYRYGAPACALDECRKRFRFRLIGLSFSVADRESVRNIIEPSYGPLEEELPSPSNAPLDDNTDHMIQRMVAGGFLGIDSRGEVAKVAYKREKYPRARSILHEVKHVASGSRGESQNMGRVGKKGRRITRAKQSLQCTIVLVAETAVVDYVFDEPGIAVENDAFSVEQDQQTTYVSSGRNTEDLVVPPPICRLSVVLRGSQLSYDSKAIANVERVVERLQPAFYDLVSLARKVQIENGRRSPTGIQLEIDATPVETKKLRSGESDVSLPLVDLPFYPKSATWLSLTSLGIRKWGKDDESNSDEQNGGNLLQSHVLIRASHVSVRTEIPYKAGSEQRARILAKQVKASIGGIVDLPFVSTKQLSITRVVNFPLAWNGVHSSSLDCQLQDPVVFYVSDTLRILSDLGASFRENSRPPPDVRYFIPWKDTTVVRAEGVYDIVLACSNDNAWADVQKGKADEYGSVVVGGDSARLQLLQSVPTEYLPDVTGLSWSLELPGAVGRFELPGGLEGKPQDRDDNETGMTKSADFSQASHHRGGSPSFVKRFRSQIEPHAGNSKHHINSSTRNLGCAQIPFLQVGKDFGLHGKMLNTEPRRNIESISPVYLDSVDRSDISLDTSGIILDLNPHHVTHLLNLVRNYAGSGTHTLSLAERSLLHRHRKTVTNTVLTEKRLPSVNECMALNLAAGHTLAFEQLRGAVDEAVHVSFKVGSFLVRAHDLPHAMCRFTRDNERICSLISGQLAGAICANRSGLTFDLIPQSGVDVLRLCGEYRIGHIDGADGEDLAFFDVSACPSLTIEGLRIQKQSYASEQWGSYHSALSFKLGKLSGCILDTSATVLLSIARACLPDQLHEDQLAIACLLAVENISVVLSEVDMLVLATSSRNLAERSGQMSNMSMQQQHYRSRFSETSLPALVTGVASVRVPFGLRYTTSTLASQTIENRGRFLLPHLSINVLMAWGGKLTPWVDDATLRAQVSHAIPLYGKSERSSFQDAGVLRQAACIEELTLEIVTDSRPSLWSSAIVEIQKEHIMRESQASRGCIPRWCSNYPNTSPRLTESVSLVEQLESHWWTFLTGAQRATIIHTHMKDVKPNTGKSESLSLRVLSDVQLTLAPEILELANDIITRSRETFASSIPDILARGFEPGRSDKVSPMSSDPNIADLNELPSAVLFTCLRSIWEAYEVNWPRKSVAPEIGKDNCTFIGFESRKIRMLFFSPILPDEVHTSDRLFVFDTCDDVVEVSAPFGVHAVSYSRTGQLGMAPHEVQTRSPGSLHHSTEQKVVSHLSIPTVAVHANGNNLCEVKGVVAVRRDHILGAEGAHYPKVSSPMNRFEKLVVVGRVTSIDVGNENSDLVSYASFGRVCSIFSLLSRALMVEAGKLATSRATWKNYVFTEVLSISEEKMLLQRPESIRATLAEACRIVEARLPKLQQRLRSLRYGGDASILVEVEVNDVANVSKRELSSGLDFSIHGVSLHLCHQEMIRLESMLFRGGFTARSENKSGNDDHVLIINIGNISLTIRDDIVHSSLKMVSDVASFVRRAAFSIPMLGYDAGRNFEAKSPNPSEAFSPKDVDLSRPGINSRDVESEPHHHRHLHFPTRPHFFTGKHRHHHSSILNLRGKSSHSSKSQTSVEIPPRSAPAKSRSVGVQFAEAVELEESSRYVARAPMSSRLTRRLHDEESEGKLPSLREDLVKTAQNFQAPKVPVNPAASFDSSASFICKYAVSHPGIEENLNPLSETASETNHTYTYVAIPTAGDTGPPRKRSKSRVRVSPVVPPAFSKLEELGHSIEQQQSDFVNAETRNFTEVSTRATRKAPRNGSAIHRGTKARRGYRSGARTLAGPLRQKELVLDTPSPTGTPKGPGLKRNWPAMTLLGTCHGIVCQYYRARTLPPNRADISGKDADLKFRVAEPRMTYVSSPSEGSQSVVVTASAAELVSEHNPKCVLTGFIQNIGVTISIAQGLLTSSLPKLIASARISEFMISLHATDLGSVSAFRENFKSDIKAVVSAFLTTRSSISEMARSTRLASPKTPIPTRKTFSTMAFDLLCENSRVKLEGFHPEDPGMCVAYTLEGIFFSVVASEDDNAALTLGVRLHDHGLTLSSASWPCNQTFRFPNVDARGVQWGETIGLPTLLKVNAEPLTNSTSIQGLRHVLFTVAGLMAFQSNYVLPAGSTEEIVVGVSDLKEFYGSVQSTTNAGATPFSRSFAAWERTKGVRMDISIRPMSLNLANGPVVARFDMHAITGIFEWNKLVESGVQLHSAVSLPKVSLMFMRMPSTEYAMSDIRPDEKRASLSIALEKIRVDVLKSQEDLTHKFVLRILVVDVCGQVRPWKILLDAAFWADEHDFVSDLQSMNYATASSSKAQTPKSPFSVDGNKPLEHRIVLLGANVKRFKLAVPLLAAEQYSSSRLAFRATELHLFVKQRFDSSQIPRRGIIQIRSHFIGVLWENNPLLSSHHAHVSMGLRRGTKGSGAHFGTVDVVVAAGTWRICPRKDVVTAVLKAKNGKENMYAAEKSKEMLRALPDVISKDSNLDGASSSSAAEVQSRNFADRLSINILRTSGFIEGLEQDNGKPGESSAGVGKDSDQTKGASKLSVPVFSAALIRNEAYDFDLMDIDFSGREGEFPKGCLQKAVNLFSDIFGAVDLDERDGNTNQTSKSSSTPLSSHPTTAASQVSRDTSVMLRFGNSLYRAQEANLGVESKFCFFAGRSSAILISHSNSPVVEELTGATTVISGNSPKLALELIPVLDEARIQSLRLIGTRFFHGINPYRPAHSLLHISRVIAVMDAKTMLLTEKRMQSSRTKRTSDCETTAGSPGDLFVRPTERVVLAVLGNMKKASKYTPSQKQFSSLMAGRREPEIRIQIRLPSPGDVAANQVDFFVGLLHFGIHQTHSDDFLQSVPRVLHFSVHEVNLRGRWDIISFQFRLRENLLTFMTNGVSPNNSGKVAFTNIFNRLQFESLQYGTHTMKLSVDALATMISVPERSVLVESTSIAAEVSYTMVKSLLRLTGQFKKLKNEVRLLMEREFSKEAKHAKSSPMSYESKSADSLHITSLYTRGHRPQNGHGHRQTLSTGAPDPSSVPVTVEKRPGRTGKKTRFVLRGESLSLRMRGYQFDESRLNAMASLHEYELKFNYDIEDAGEATHTRGLVIEFANLKLIYNDEYRGIHSDLCRIPEPHITFRVVDTDTNLFVNLLGELELKIGPGIHYWQEYKKLWEQTIRGITQGNETDSALPEASGLKKPELWEGRQAQVSVRLEPRIDLIGNLTADMLQFVAAREGRVHMVPKYLYDYLVVPLERISEKPQANEIETDRPFGTYK